MPEAHVDRKNAWGTCALSGLGSCPVADALLQAASGAGVPASSPPMPASPQLPSPPPLPPAAAAAAAKGEFAKAVQCGHMYSMVCGQRGRLLHAVAYSGFEDTDLWVGRQLEPMIAAAENEHLL